MKHEFISISITRTISSVLEINLSGTDYHDCNDKEKHDIINRLITCSDNWNEEDAANWADEIGKSTS